MWADEETKRRRDEETKRRRAAARQRGNSEVVVVTEQWIEEEVQIRVMIDIDGRAPDGGIYSHLCARSKRLGPQESHYPRIVWKSSLRFHTMQPTWAEFLAGQPAGGASMASLEAQLEAQGGRQEVAKIDALLRARGFVPVSQEPIWQQTWVRRVQLSQ
jgi:hypothetical protein